MLHIPESIQYKVGNTIQTIAYPMYGSVKEITEYVELIRTLGYFIHDENVIV